MRRRRRSVNVSAGVGEGALQFEWSIPTPCQPEKRAQILHGAAVVFAEDGYEGASMSRIAREANVSKGTLYNHFEGKADLFTAYMQQACAQSMAQVFANLVRGCRAGARRWGRSRGAWWA